MKEETLSKIREEIMDYRINKEKLKIRQQEIKTRINELEKIDIVQEYIKLLKIADENNKKNIQNDSVIQEDNIYKKHIKEIKENESCNIYLLLNIETYLYPLPRTRYYLHNLEQEQEIIWNEEDYDENIKNSEIIYHNNDRNYGTYYYSCAKIMFDWIQREYFSYLLEHSQEETKEYILSKYKRK